MISFESICGHAALLKWTVIELLFQKKKKKISWKLQNKTKIKNEFIHPNV